MEIALIGAPAASGGALVVGVPPPAPTPIGQGCRLAFDPGRGFMVLPLATAASGRWRLGFRLPPSPALAGGSLALQAAVLEPAAPLGFSLANALRLVCGRRTGVLAGRPGPPGPHLARIGQLGSGSWLDLGVPAADPSHGLPTGRAYTPRMAWSAGLRGAFLTGEQEHGYVIPATNRYVDDVWFYDLAAHAWVCVKPGSPVNTISLRLNHHRFEEDFQGRLVPVAQLGHGYELVTYDDWTQKFLMFPAPNTYWVPSMGARRLQWLVDPNLPATQRASPWLFDTVSGRWERLPPGTGAPQFASGSRGMILRYLPGRRRVWMWDGASWHRDRVWFFDTDAYAWSSTASVNPAPVLTGTGVSCYDPDRERVYVYGADVSKAAHLWYYDVRSNRWHDTGTQGVPPAKVIYTAAFAGMTYDRRAGVILFKVGNSSTYPGFRVFDVVRGTWLSTTIVPPVGLQPLFRWKYLNAFYAGEYNVHVFHVSGNRSQTGRILVYRH